jgi:hypothetical protein
MLKDNADKISPDDKSKLEAAASAVKEALKGTDAAAIKSASEKLNEVWQAISTELYKQPLRPRRNPRCWSRRARSPKAKRNPAEAKKKGRRPD